METSGTDTAKPKWYMNEKVQKRIFIAWVAFFVIEGFISIVKKHCDYNLHYTSMGAAFWTGDPYSCGIDWYTTGRYMFDGLLNLIPYRVSRAIVYCFTLGCLYWMFCKLREYGPKVIQNKQISNMIAGLTVLMSFVYLRRDLDECGLHIILVTMMMAGCFAIIEHRKIRAGFFLACAASFKTTPILFLPFLIYKREWKATVAMIAFIGVINMVPAVFLGVDKTLECHQQIAQRAMKTVTNNDGSGLAESDIKWNNQSLKQGITRYLVHYPEDHVLHLEHPAFIQFFDFEFKTAKRITLFVLGCFALYLAYRFRKRFSDDHPRETIAQFSVVAILCSLLAPLCWKQHLVVSLPVFVIILQKVFSSPPAEAKNYKRILYAMAFFEFVGSRGLLGQTLHVVVMSYNVHAIVMLIGIFTVLHITAKEISESEESAEGNITRPNFLKESVQMTEKNYS